MGKQSEGKGIEIFGAVTHLLLIIGMIISLSIHDNQIANAPADFAEKVSISTETTGHSADAVSKDANGSVENAAGDKTNTAATGAGGEKAGKSGNEAASPETASTAENATSDNSQKTETSTSGDTGSSTSGSSDSTTESTSSENTSDNGTNVASNTDTKADDKNDTKTDDKSDNKTDNNSDTKVDNNASGKENSSDSQKQDQRQDQKQQDRKTEKKKDKSTGKGNTSKNTLLQDIITGTVGFRIWDHVEYIDDLTVYHLKDTTEFDPGFYKDLYGDILGENGFVSYEDMLKHYEQYGKEELRYTTKESYETVVGTAGETAAGTGEQTGTKVETAVYEFVISSVVYDGRACSDYTCNLNNGQPVRVAYELTYKTDAKGQKQELLSAKPATGEPAGFGMTLNFGTAGDAVTFSWVTFNSLTNGKTPTGTGTGSISGVTTSGKPVQVTFLYRML